MKNAWDLTDREAQILRSLAQAGDANSKRAARDLDLSHRTIEAYIQRALKKMGAKKRLEAVLMYDREYRVCPHCIAERLERAVE